MGWIDDRAPASMNGLQSADIAEARARAQLSDSQLVLIVGRQPQALREAADAAASQLGWPAIDLNATLADALVELTPAERIEEAWDALERLLDPFRNGVILDGTDILFEPTLGYRPYEAMRRIARRVPIVGVWLGRVEGLDVIRGEPGHPEYTRVRLDVPFVAIPSEGVSS